MSKILKDKTSRRQELLAHQLWLEKQPEYKAFLVEKCQISYEMESCQTVFSEHQKHKTMFGVDLLRRIVELGHRAFQLEEATSKSEICKGFCTRRQFGILHGRVDALYQTADSYHITMWKERREAEALARAVEKVDLNGDSDMTDH